MRQTGVVIARSDRHAVVEVRRMSACAGCHKAASESSVMTGSDAATEPHTDVCADCQMFPVVAELSVTALNEIGAEVGDRVVIESSTQLILGYAAAVFSLPLLLAFICGIAAALWILPGAPAAAFIGAVVGFAAAFVIDKRIIDRSAKEKTVYTVIKRITKGPGLPA